PGAVSVGAGSLVYGVSMSNGSGLFAPPAGFTNILTMSDASMWADGEDVVPAATGPVNPQWTWDFNAPRTWLASVLTLGEAVTELAFTAQPTTSLTCHRTIGPLQLPAQNAEHRAGRRDERDVEASRMAFCTSGSRTAVGRLKVLNQSGAPGFGGGHSIARRGGWPRGGLTQ